MNDKPKTKLVDINGMINISNEEKFFDTPINSWDVLKITIQEYNRFVVIMDIGYGFDLFDETVKNIYINYSANLFGSEIYYLHYNGCKEEIFYLLIKTDLTNIQSKDLYYFNKIKIKLNIIYSQNYLEFLTEILFFIRKSHLSIKQDKMKMIVYFIFSSNTYYINDDVLTQFLRDKMVGGGKKNSKKRIEKSKKIIKLKGKIPKKTVKRTMKNRTKREI